ncbi:DUF1816 domain-containing protein [Funiculus sociatus]|uniref:DUF1816 domain-containing protein n=1 Tax=Funiculus sociatus TaxID=450527 RepID=UPI003296DF7B
MAFLNIIREVLTGFVQGFRMAWWVEIATTEPRCIYYFGPFDNSAQAAAACPGYIEDIHKEKAQGMKVKIKLCKPEALTVCDEENDEL